jgi:hypothetical protein
MPVGTQTKNVRLCCLEGLIAENQAVDLRILLSVREKIEPCVARQS